MKKVLLTFAFVFTLAGIFSCSKDDNDPPADTTGDEVVGVYAGQTASFPNPTIPISVEVYKTSQHNYGLKKLNSSSFPDFTFKLDEDMVAAGTILGLRYYKIPEQVSGGVAISQTSTMVLHKTDNRLEFTIRANTGTVIDSYTGYRR